MFTITLLYRTKINLINWSEIKDWPIFKDTPISITTYMIITDTLEGGTLIDSIYKVYTVKNVKTCINNR